MGCREAEGPTGKSPLGSSPTPASGRYAPYGWELWKELAACSPWLGHLCREGAERK